MLSRMPLPPLPISALLSLPFSGLRWRSAQSRNSFAPGRLPGYDGESGRCRLLSPSRIKVNGYRCNTSGFHGCYFGVFSYHYDRLGGCRCRRRYSVGYFGSEKVMKTWILKYWRDIAVTYIAATIIGLIVALLYINPSVKAQASYYSVLYPVVLDVITVSNPSTVVYSEEVVSWTNENPVHGVKYHTWGSLTPDWQAGLSTSLFSDYDRGEDFYNNFRYNVDRCFDNDDMACAAVGYADNGGWGFVNNAPGQSNTIRVWAKSYGAAGGTAAMTNIEVIYYGVPPTATPTPTITPLPCEYVPYDIHESIEEGIYDWSVPLGAGNTQVTFLEDTEVIFYDDLGEEIETLNCTAGLPCDTLADNRGVGQTFTCTNVALEDNCGDGLWEYEPVTCEDGIGSWGGIEPFDPPEGIIEFEPVITQCISYNYNAFSLTDNPLAIILENFDITLPTWGWTGGTWELCLEAWAFTALAIGSMNFLPFVSLVMTMVTLILLAMFVRR